jgi:hypothetical protein
MTKRYSVRKAVDGSACIAADGRVGHGQLLDLSVPGCLIETDLPLHVGQPVQLRLRHSDGHALRVPLAVVRWVKGRHAGMEFLRMAQADQVRLRSHVGLPASRRTSVSAWSEPITCTGISMV